MEEMNLDDPARFASVDQSGMLGVLEAFPQQLAEAIEIGAGGVELPTAAGVRNIVVLGMGGSGISGDVVGALAADRGLSVPVVASKQYEAPGFVSEDTLVFAVSYSGNTEETLSAFEECLERGARIVAVSSGGRLTELCRAKGVPLFAIPAGLQPRAALGYLLAPIMCALERMGLIAVGVLETRSSEYGPGTGLDANPAKRLAKDLVGFMPVVYGVEGYLTVAALRWKCQFNEMANIPSFHNCFPELNHNETVGWQNLPEVCSSSHIIVLGEPDLAGRLDKRIKVTLDLIRDSVGHTTRVCARGANTTERLLDIVYFGDWTSVYLALALGEDPTPIPRIDELKKRLAE
jgi:glucose/mannose-6-phosphate isomerase